MNSIQEQYFIDHIEVFEFFICFLGQKSYADFVKLYKFQEQKSYQYFRQLEKIKLIKFTANGVPVCRHKGQLNLKQGALADKLYFETRYKILHATQKRYLVDKSKTCSQCGTGFLTSKSLAIFVQKSRELFNELSEKSQYEVKYSKQKDLILVGWVAAIAKMDMEDPLKD